MHLIYMENQTIHNLIKKVFTKIDKNLYMLWETLEMVTTYPSFLQLLFLNFIKRTYSQDFVYGSY